MQECIPVDSHDSTEKQSPYRLCQGSWTINYNTFNKSNFIYRLKEKMISWTDEKKWRSENEKMINKKMIKIIKKKYQRRE